MMIKAGAPLLGFYLHEPSSALSLESSSMYIFMFFELPALNGFLSMLSEKILNPTRHVSVLPTSTLNFDLCSLNFLDAAQVTVSAEGRAAVWAPLFFTV